MASSTIPPLSFSVPREYHHNVGSLEDIQLSQIGHGKSYSNSCYALLTWGRIVVGMRIIPASVLAAGSAWLSQVSAAALDTSEQISFQLGDIHLGTNLHASVLQNGETQSLALHRRDSQAARALLSRLMSGQDQVQISNGSHTLTSTTTNLKSAFDFDGQRLIITNGTQTIEGTVQGDPLIKRLTSKSITLNNGTHNIEAQRIILRNDGDSADSHKDDDANKIISARDAKKKPNKSPTGADNPLLTFPDGLPAETSMTCKGGKGVAHFCKQLRKKNCAKARNMLIDNAIYQSHKSKGEVGVCKGGCGCFVEGAPGCAFLGSQMKEQFNAMFEHHNCKKCMCKDYNIMGGRCTVKCDHVAKCGGPELGFLGLLGLVGVGA